MNKNETMWGTSSMVCGILSILLCIMPYFTLPLGIMAIVFYAIQKKRKSTTSATAGLITGIIGIVISVILLMILAIALIFGW